MTDPPLVSPSSSRSEEGLTVPQLNLPEEKSRDQESRDQGRKNCVGTDWTVGTGGVDGTNWVVGPAGSDGDDV